MITGYAGVKAVGAATIANFGTVEATGSSNNGVILEAGGSLTNGSVNNSTALITGYYGVMAAGAAATIVNFGKIVGAGYGVAINDGGTLTNGSAADTGASISGVTARGAAATVTNFGTIAGPTTGLFGVYVTYGGEVTNGAPRDTTAVISGGLFGVRTNKNLILANYGTIEASGMNGAGVSASGLGGGRITNGTPADTTALISGYVGVEIGELTTLINNGTIQGSLGGVELSGGGGFLINGSAENTTALITGRVGLYSIAAGVSKIANFGTIQGSGAGVTLRYADAILINGSMTDRKALIVGGDGFFGYGRPGLGSVTLKNFGTIEGTNGVAVELTGARNKLIVEAGSAFIGAVHGGGGTLVLAGAAGAGAQVAPLVSGFATYVVDPGSQWTLPSPLSLASGGRLVDGGALIVSGAFSNDGRVSVLDGARLVLTGTITNAGVISLAGATQSTLLRFAGPTVTLTGGGAIQLGSSAENGVVVQGASGTLTKATPNNGRIG